jgi:hypothetical protein
VTFAAAVTSAMRASILLVIALWFGCKQQRGERCQLHDDCAAGLTCVLSAGATCLMGGTCQPERAAGKRCSLSSDCASGFTCTTVDMCVETRLTICVAPPDLMSGDFAATD